MALITTKLVSGENISFHDNPIGSGAEKVVFFTKDKTQVVCFYKNLPDILTDRAGRRTRLDKILTVFNCTAGDKGAYWRTHFCWPTGIIDGDRGTQTDFFARHNLLDPPLGIVTPAYPDNFFFKDTSGKKREKDGRWFTGEKSRSRLPPEEKGHFLNYLLVCAKMARAVRKMHNHGLAHSDLSNKNVLIDPRNGNALLIDIDALVVPGIAPPTVLGTRGYIAPEVVAGKGLPQIDTDRHALAVLIYETLLLRHPIHGPKVHNKDPNVDDAMHFGEKALFVEHPTDKSNAVSPAPAIPFSRLGPLLAELVHLAFVEGLHDTRKRPGADRWERAIYHTLDLLHPSPSSSEWFVLAPGMPMKCPFTKRAIQHPVPYARFYWERSPGQYADDKRTLTIYNGLRLRKWHTVVGCSPGEDADPKEQGCFQMHEGRWWLTNNSGIPFEVINGTPVQPGKPVELKRGLKVCFPGGLQTPGQPAGRSRLLEFDFMKP